MPTVCEVDGCTDPHKAKGWCRRHYERALNHNGDPLGGYTSPGVALAYFRAHVDDTTDQCIIWPYTTSKGYGWISIDGHGRSVHSVACERHYGPRPPGLQAIHSPVICHEPLCFNAKGGHVTWGTVQQNMGHKVLDGTNRSGERCYNAKLTWAAVTEIRLRYAAGGISQQVIADEYGVSQGTVWQVTSGHTWKVA